MHRAVRTGDALAVARLIKGGADVNATNRYGVTPLSLAADNEVNAREGAADAIRALGDVRANLNAVDPEGTSALIVAVINGHYDAMAALLDKGADPNARLKGTVLKRVYDAGDNRLGEGATPLMRGARGGDAAVMRMLLAAGADAKLAQKSGNNPILLAAAASAGRSGAEDARVPETAALEAIAVAVAAGVDINSVSATGDTAVHLAATTNQGSPSMIRLLADRGANLNIKNKAGRTPLDAAMRARDKNDDTIVLLKSLGAEASPAPRTDIAASPDSRVN